MKFLTLVLLLSGSSALAAHPKLEGNCFETDRPGEFLVVTSSDIHGPFLESLAELEKNGFTIINKFPFVNSALVLYRPEGRLSKKKKEFALSTIEAMLEDGMLEAVSCNGKMGL